MFKNPVLLLSITFLLIFVGCSSFVQSTRESLFGKESTSKKTKQSQWVSKDKYDDLLAKYKNLEEKYKTQMAAEETAPTEQSLQQLDEMAQSNLDTVDPFANGVIAAKANAPQQEASLVQDAPKNTETVNKELDYYTKATNLLSNNKKDEALKLFQYLESNASRQIKIRSKLSIGRIYQSKQQYDLALQVFESIIRENAFSVYVLEALKSAAECSSKLGLDQKNKKYNSILKDFFGLEV